MRRTGGRRRLRIAVRALACAGVCAVVWGCLIEPARLVERDVTLALPRWTPACDGLRLDVVADTHTGSPRNGLDNLDRIVGRLLASDAEVVLLGGDYLILEVPFGTYVAPERIAAHLQPLAAHKRVYAVLGNHDWWKGGEHVRRTFEAAGIVVLQNEAREVAAHDCRFWIAGIGDLMEGHPDITGTLAQVDDAEPVIALTHEPDLFAAIPARVSLTIAGHTHGGQVDPWPFFSEPGSFKRGSRLLRGHIVDGDRHLFVTPGIGTSILPVRFGATPEISRLTLRAPATPP